MNHPDSFFDADGIRKSGLSNPSFSSPSIYNRGASPTSRELFTRVYPIQRLRSNSNTEDVTERLLTLLKVEQRRLHQSLKAFETEFFKQNQRHVKTAADIQVKASEYRRYGEIKKEIDALKTKVGNSKESVEHDVSPPPHPISSVGAIPTVHTPIHPKKAHAYLDCTQFSPRMSSPRRAKRQNLSTFREANLFPKARFIDQTADATHKQKAFIQGISLFSSSNFQSMIHECNATNILKKINRLLNLQRDFRSRKIPSYVDIGYHHTRSENLVSIQMYGLLSLPERENRAIKSHYNGHTYGDGIYCSDDPHLHAGPRYGDATILLGRMKGNVLYFTRSVPKCRGEIHTFTHGLKGIDILKCSDQCIPLYSFPSKLLKSRKFSEILSDFHTTTQVLLDEIFNVS